MASNFSYFPLPILKKLMDYYKDIFRNLPFPCLLFEKKEGDFVIKEANSIYCHTTNTIGKDLTGRLVEEIFPQNPFSTGLQEVLESLHIAWNTRNSHKIDILRYDLYNSLEGIFELKYWQTENLPIFGEEGDIIYILNVVKDITAEIQERERCNILQEKLDVKTQKHEQFVGRITDGLFSLDTSGNFVSLNKGLIDIAETPEHELLKMNFAPFCGREHLDRIVEYFNAAIGGSNQKFEAGFVSGKGTNKVLEISLVPLKSGEIITGLYGIAKDISKLKKSENALVQSERKFKALVQEGSDLIGILDPEGKYKFVSETSAAVLGIPPADFIGKTAFDYVHPADRDRVVEEFSVLEKKNQTQINPFRFKNAGGEWRWVETIATNLINDPAVEGIVTNSRDVTDHINSQKAIRESEERYRSFFENSTDAIMVTIPDGRILAANPSACKMFQRSEEELCTMGRAAVTNSNDPRVQDALELRRKNGTATAELFFLRKDGTQFPGEITSSIFNDSEGNPRSSMIIRDITERKIGENKLLELNRNLQLNTGELIGAIKGLEQFSYIISHNLRAPVANILGLTKLLNGPEYSEEVRENLRKEIRSNAKRMDKVMKDLNQILQVKHDFSEARQLIDLNEIVASIKTGLGDLIEKEKINIVTDFREIDKIKSTSSFIHSIFYNLIFNSIKFRRPDIVAIINITSQRQNGTYRFIFKDNGVGLDLTKKKDEIFGLYKRFHQHVEGKGMGLFMVKTQVEMLGGKITMESEVNCGSSFIIEFKKEILKI